MKRRIMTYGGYFERFIATLTDKELRKLEDPEDAAIGNRKGIKD